MPSRVCNVEEVDPFQVSVQTKRAQLVIHTHLLSSLNVNTCSNYMFKLVSSLQSSVHVHGKHCVCNPLLPPSLSPPSLQPCFTDYYSLFKYMQLVKRSIKVYMFL